MLQGEQLSAKCAELKNIRLARKENLRNFSVINITKFPARRLKPVCNHGHALSGDNLMFSASGIVRCRACHTERSRQVRRKLSANKAINEDVEIKIQKIENLVDASHTEWLRLNGVKRGF